MILAMPTVVSEFPLPPPLLSLSSLSACAFGAPFPRSFPQVFSNKHLSKQEQIWNRGEHPLMPPSIILMSGGVSRPHNEMQVIKDIKRIHCLPGLFNP